MSDVIKQLKNAILIITYQCNQRCLYCNDYKIELPECEKQGIYQIVDHLSKLGISSVDVIGGEPLTHPSIVQILTYLHENGMRTILHTNGTMPNIAISGILDNVDEMYIGLNGRRQSHDKLRGTGTWEKVCQTVSLVRQSNIPIVLDYVVTALNNNVDDLKFIVDIAQKNNCRINFQPVFNHKLAHVTQGMLESRNISLDQEQAKRFFLMVRDHCPIENQYHNAEYISQMTEKGIFTPNGECRMGKDSVIVDPRLHICRCYDFIETEEILFDGKELYWKDGVKHERCECISCPHNVHIEYSHFVRWS